MRVKICGITNLQDAQTAVRLGADELGFNFYPESPRYVSPADAAKVVDVLPDDVLPVGVFVDASIETIISIERAVGLMAIQLHGDETPDFVSDLRSRTNSKVIKALRVSPGFEPESVFEHAADAILLDAYSADARGGTGKTFEWSKASAVVPLVNELYLAGGLGPLNVAAAINAVRPAVVDVASGVESRPGIKDADMLEAFIRNAKNA
ncbi:MAG: phosphoribosylanthranilate isomerase [Pyrinomonadaceae bacterium]|nr:phosphoribosylanthranilate isomerase [Pyrinomonadaceae bacterium]